MIETLEKRPSRPGTEAKLNIGSMLLEMGRIDPREASRIAQFQHEKGIRFGEAALQLGLVSAVDIDQVLARQFNYSCLRQDQGDYPRELAAAYAPASRQVTALKRVRSQLMNRWFARGRKSLPVIGIGAGDGASTFVANLAVLFSQLGQRTLVVDADLRSHTLSTIFRIPEKTGLSDVLAGRARRLAPTVIEHFADLSVLGAGTPPPNPQELLSRPVFRSLVHEHALEYDCVFYDAAPMCEAGDALEIAAAAGCALVLVRKHHTKIADLEYARNELQASGIEVAGTVMIEF
jgi:chain length determinant protein tyrosine kinase EpsG